MPQDDQIDSQALAEITAQSMYARDHAARGLDIVLDEVRPGYARMSMTVQPAMMNSHDVCHGGFVFTLADTAFAYACNSYNQVTVASACHIDFLAPGRTGDRLTAEAVEQSLGGRTGVYDVTVTDQNGIRVALFRGKSYRISGEVTSRS